MTPEQAAEKAAEALAMAADNALVPGVAGAYVGIADGWIRLYTALAHTPPPGPLTFSVPEVKVGSYTALRRDLERSLRQPDAEPADLAVKVREVRDIQGQPGNWDYSPYMHGMFNGLELVVSILEGERDPDYRDEPEGGYRRDRASADTTTAPTEADPAPGEAAEVTG